MGNLLIMNKKIILEKPSGTISISDPMTALQRKFYDAFLYVAKETLKENPTKTDFEISLKELKEFFGIEDKKNTHLKESIKDLMKLVAEYDILDKTKERWGAFSILPYVDISIDIETKIGTVKFEIPTIVRKAMLNNQGIFGKIDLIVIKGLNSKYSIILYELLKDYENVEIPKMDIKTFRKIFGIENKYKLFQDLKKRVLKPSIEEINNNPNIKWEISYRLIKTGPKYTHIKFIKKEKPNLKQVELKKENKKVDTILILIPEEYRTTSLRRFLLDALEKHPLKYIESQIKLVNSKEVKDYIAFLKTAIKDDYAGYEQQKKLEEEKKQREEEKKKKLEELKKLKKQLLEKAESIFNNKSEEEQKELIKEAKGLFGFSNEVAKDIAIGKIFEKICKEKGIELNIFNKLD